MSKAFREAFPTLKLEEELEGLLDTTEVTKISANHEHTHIRIYLRAKRLIFKKNIWKLEKAITEQIFQNRAIQVKIIESYELSEQYTPKSLIEVYKDSILDERLQCARIQSVADGGHGISGRGPSDSDDG